MAYTKNSWVDGVSPLSAVRLNNLETQYDQAKSEIDLKLAISAYTAADVLTKLKTVDGVGSGLDASLLCGLSEKAFFNGFGCASDGDVTISINTTLNKDAMFYNNLTINAGVTLTIKSICAAIFVKGTLTLNGNISAIGKGSAGGSGGTPGNHGGAGGGGLMVYAKTITGTGTIQANGGAGLTGNLPTTGTYASGGDGTAGKFFGLAMTGGKGAVITSHGATTAAASNIDVSSYALSMLKKMEFANTAIDSGAAGGGAGDYQYSGTRSGTMGGNGGAGAYGAGGYYTAWGAPSGGVSAGGGGGGGGGIAIVVSAAALPAITVEAKGGNGGNGISSSNWSGGGAGGGGGIVSIIAPGSSATISVAGGSPGTGVLGAVSPTAGSAGLAVLNTI